MKSLNRTNQGGSVTSFVVIGLFLVIGLATSAYLFNQRVQQVRKEQAIAQAEANKSRQPKESPKSETTAVKEDAANDPETSSANSNFSTDLPTTGIEDSVVESLGLFTIVYSLASFVVSRRKTISTSLT